MSADTARKVEIRVAGPLPASVLITLTKLIGAAWPDATMIGSSGSAAVFMVASGQGRDLEEGQVRSAVSEAPGDDLEINHSGPDGISAATPIDVAQALVPVVKAALDAFPEAKNYLEFLLVDPDTRDRYVLHFCRSAGQTPHALRLQAEAELLAARADAHRDNAGAVQRLLRSPAAGRGDTFESGVKAALEAMRALNFGTAADMD